jgi:hypothetical protein
LECMTESDESGVEQLCTFFSKDVGDDFCRVRIARMLRSVPSPLSVLKGMREGGDEPDDESTFRLACYVLSVPLLEELDVLLQHLQRNPILRRVHQIRSRLSSNLISTMSNVGERRDVRRVRRA